MTAPAGPALQLPSLRECETASFDWSSTAGPFKAWIWTGTGGVGTILKDFGILQTSQVAWAVDLARGHTVQLAISDAAGQTVNSQPSTILPGNCPPGFPLRKLDGDKPDPPAASSANGPPVSQPAPSQPAASSVKAAEAPAPTPTFSAVASKSLDPGPSYSVFSADPLPTSSGSSGGNANADFSVRVAAAPSALVSSVTSSAVASLPAVSSGKSSMTISSFTGPIPTPSSRLSGTVPSHASTSSVSSSTSASLQPDAAIAGSGSKMNATTIAGIAGGVGCGILIFGLIFYLFCRVRNVRQDPFDDSGQDFVHFTDSASSTSLPPIYARYRSESSYNVSSEVGSNMAGRGAGGATTEGDDLEKAGPSTDVNQVNDQSTGLGLVHLDTSSSSASVYDMTPRPILDPKILGRSAKSNPPRVRPPTASTWRSSFGALVSRLGPLSPGPGPSSAFSLGRRGSSTVGTISANGTQTGSRKDTAEGDDSEMLGPGVGLSRNDTLTHQNRGHQSQSEIQTENPPSYRASISTFANHTLSPPITTNTEIDTTNIRTLLPAPTPRRKSDATTRSRRSVATFGADILQPDIPLPTAAGLLSPNDTAHSPGSEDSFGDILDSSELAYAQPSPAPAPGLGIITSSSATALSAVQPLPLLPVLPPLAHLADSTSLSGTTTPALARPAPSAYTLRGIYNHPNESVVSRVSIAKFERPRTLTLTRDSFASFATEMNGSNLSVNTISAGERAGSSVQSGSGFFSTMIGKSSTHLERKEEQDGSGKVKDAEVEWDVRFSGKWSGWRRSLRSSSAAPTEDYLGHAI